MRKINWRGEGRRKGEALLKWNQHKLIISLYQSNKAKLYIQPWNSRPVNFPTWKCFFENTANYIIPISLIIASDQIWNMVFRSPLHNSKSRYSEIRIWTSSSFSSLSHRLPWLAGSPMWTKSNVATGTEQDLCSAPTFKLSPEWLNQSDCLSSAADSFPLSNTSTHLYAD